MNFNDLKTAEALREQYTELETQIDGVENGTALNVSLYGNYVCQDLIGDCKPVVAKYLRARQQEIVEKLKDLGVTF